jgi:FKBP-type peptidyl-prolyl cis-trans isomerase
MNRTSITLLSLVFLFGCEAKKANTDTAEKKPAATKTSAAKTAAKAAKPATKAAAKPAAKAAAKPAATAPKAIPGMPPKPKAIPAPADVAKAPADAVKTASGLSSKVIKAGTGKVKPKAEDTVKVHYTGWTTDGKMFDSSVARGEPTSFPLNRVIKGWTEGVAMMVVGETRRFWIPGNLAYGDKPARPGAPSGTLVFDVELLEIEKAPSPAENAARFEKFLAAFKAASEASCKCKDMACAQQAMMALRAVKPPTVAPKPEWIKRMDPYRKAMKECAEKMMKGMGKPVGAPQGMPKGAIKAMPKAAPAPAKK